MIWNLLSSLVSLFFVMAAGFFLRKRGHIDARVTKGLSAILVTAGMPMMMIHGLQQPYSPERLRELGIMLGGYAVVILAGILTAAAWCLVRRTPLQDCGAWLNCAAFTNAIFMARPVAVSLWGERVLFPLVGIMFGYNLFTFSLGAFFFGMGRSNDGAGLPRQIFRSLLNPVMLTGAAGLFLFVFSIKLPAPLSMGLEMMVSLSTPLAMMIIGSQLAESSLREILSDGKVYLLSLLRLVAAPILAWALLRPLIRDPVLFGLLVLAALMPTGTAVSVFAERYDNNAQFVSRAVFLSTLLSLATIPLLAVFLL